jgi:hypothetical protein
MARPHSNPQPGEDQKYFILMIVCDGVINDMQQTIDEVVRGSETPLSIIIVGVGDEDFSMMDELDADDKPLYSVADKKYMSRDIVQFVPFNEFKDKSYHQLAMATLDEIPREVVNYFISRKVLPKRLDNAGQGLGGGLRSAAEASEDTRPSGKVEENADAEMPRFLRDEKLRLLQGAISQGYPRDDVEEVLNQCGLPATSMEMLCDVLTNGEKGQNPMTVVNPELIGAAFDRDRPSKQGLLVRQGTGGDWSGMDGKGSGGSKPRGQQLPGVCDDEDVDRPPERHNQDLKAKAKKPKKKKDAGGDDISQLCKVCFEKPIDTVFLECGHQICCDGCSKAIGSLCPLCRQTITKICRTFVS